MIIWAGTSNKDVGMVIEHYPKVIIPRRKQTIQTVPGRNGDIVIDEGGFENYEQSYNAFLDAKRFGGLERVIPKLSDWLLGHSGYQRLEDSYFPDVYRMAYYTGGAEFVSVFNEYGEGTLTFNCAPEKYYKFGERTVDISNGDMLSNPSSFPAAPLIMLTGSGAATLKFGTNQLIIEDVGTSLTIDIKEHRAYSGTTNRASTITGNYDSMKLQKSTVVTWTGGITSVKIIPRWWTI